MKTNQIKATINLCLLWLVGLFFLLVNTSCSNDDPKVMEQ